METSVHDTVDLAEELDRVDEALTTGPLDTAARGRPTEAIERALVGMANAIWAVVGLVVWLPQVVRSVLGAALKVVHSALTHQASDRAVAGIQRVSRSYAGRFIERRGRPVTVGRRHELRPVRLAGEVLWAALFYLVVLRWVAPSRFVAVWHFLGREADALRTHASGAAAGLKGILLPDLAGLDASRLEALGVLLLASLVGLGLGFWLGRRSR